LEGKKTREKNTSQIMEMDLKKTLLEWLRDLGEVILILILIIVVSRLLLGAHMLVPLVAVTSCSMLHANDEIGMASAKFAQSIGINCYASNEYKNLEDLFSSEEEIKKLPFKNGFSIGDMIIVITPNGKGEIFGFKFPTLFSETKFGDVIIYNRDKKHGDGEPIIHRVVGIVRVKNWSVEGTEGTLGCLSEEDFNNKYIPMIVNCINGKEESCPYREYPKKENFKFFITKGDNNGGIDQCSPIAYPVNEEQLSARGWIRLPYIGWLKLILNALIGLGR
jgi:signal peptidase I